MKKKIFLSILAFVFLILISFFLYQPKLDQKKVDFSSDGCSMFPDKWHYDCCYTHDQSYWNGGKPSDRLKADTEFKQCVADISGNFIAGYMYVGVRVGGHPIMPLPWRWDFGTPYKKGY